MYIKSVFVNLLYIRLKVHVAKSFVFLCVSLFI